MSAHQVEPALRGGRLDLIASAICAEYPDEPNWAAIAEVIAVLAAADGIPVHVIVMWIHDRPQHDLTAEHWYGWSEHYKLQRKQERK